MYNKFTRTLTIGVLFSTALFGCHDTKLDSLSVAPDAPTLVNGRLKFASLESFQAYMKANEAKTVAQLLEANRAMGFVSHLRLSEEADLALPKPMYASTLHCLRDRLKPAATKTAAVAALPTATSSSATTTDTDNDGGTEVIPVEMVDIYNYIDADIADPLLGSILDENREAIIGSLVYRAGNDYCFYYPAGQEALVENFYQQVDSGELNLQDAEMHVYGNLIAQRVCLVTNRQEDGEGQVANLFPLPFVNNRSVEGNEPFTNGNPRLECQIWQGNWGVWASSGIKTHATRYARKWVFFWGWVDQTCSEVGTFANLTYTVPGSTPGTAPTNVKAFEVNETNAAVAVKRFDWSTAQVGYSPGGGAAIQFLLSQMTVKIPNPNVGPTKPASLQVHIDALTSNHSGVLSNGRSARKTLTW